MESMAGASLLRPQGTSFPPSDGFPRRSSPSSRITSGVSSRSSPSLSFLCARCSHSPSVSVAPRSPAYSLSSRCSWAVESRKVVRGRCLLSTAQEFPEPNKAEGDGSDKVQAVLLDIFNSLLIRLGREGRQNGLDVLRILKGANSFIPHIVLGSTVLALAYPPSFTWFTTRYYAPALGFLMFAVGVNSSAKDFLEAIGRPRAIITGYIGQFIVKPFFGYLFGILSVTVFRLPTSIGAGIMLVSCVSGAQLSNYATFLTDPSMAPLSIVMTSLSTATAVFVTPALSFLLIGKKLPVDVRGMMLSITQIVVVPIALGLFLNRLVPFPTSGMTFFLLFYKSKAPEVSSPDMCCHPAILPPLSVIVTALCVGSPLAINVASIVSPFGMTILTLILGFHASSFVAGYLLPGIVFRKAPDMKALQRTISFETGMQSSLLALALANRFFPDPLVGVPPAISVVLMSLMGFSLVMMWSKKDT